MKKILSKYVTGICCIALGCVAVSIIVACFAALQRRDLKLRDEADREREIREVVSSIERVVKSEQTLANEQSNSNSVTFQVACEELKFAINRCHIDDSLKIKLRQFADLAQNGDTGELVGVYNSVCENLSDDKTVAENITEAIKNYCESHGIGVLAEYAETAKNMSKYSVEKPKNKGRFTAFVESMTGGRFQLKNAYDSVASEKNTLFCVNAYFALDDGKRNFAESCVLYKSNVKRSNSESVEKAVAKIAGSACDVGKNFTVASVEEIDGYLFYTLDEQRGNYQAKACIREEDSEIVFFRLTRKKIR